MLKSKDVFFRCVEEANEAIMLTDTSGVLLYVNPAWCSVYEYSLSDALGQKPSLLHSGLHDSDFYREMWRTISEKHAWKGSIVNKTKSGRYVPVTLSITPFRNDDESIAGYMGIALDMSEQKQLQMKLLQQERLASIGLLASGIAHEIGTPLGIIRGRAEMLASEVNSESYPAQWLSTIIRQIDRISTLLTSLLRLSRQQNIGGKHQPMSLESSIREILILVEQQLAKFNVSTELKVDEGLKIKAQPEKIQQIFLNLLVNAAHAIEQAVKDGRRDGHRLQIHGFRESGLVCVSLTDTGCGISEENLPKLFHAFFTTRPDGQGTGLGLPIVKELLEEFGATISISSRVNEGSCFTLRFPAHHPPEISGKVSAD